MSDEPKQHPTDAQLDEWLRECEGTLLFKREGGIRMALIEAVKEARKEAASWQSLALRNYEDGCAFREEMREYFDALQRLAAMWRPFMGLPMLDLVRDALNRVKKEDRK